MNKPSIQECCQRLLPDPKQKQGMLNLLEFLQGLKLKPLWYHKTSFKCNYKSQRVLYINFISGNRLRLRVCTVGDAHGIGNMELYLQAIPQDLRDEFANYQANIHPCDIHTTCVEDCERTRSYYITSPTPAQFTWVEKFILARMAFIDMG